MRASSRTSDLAPRPFRGDESAVSEVVGQILMFGILSMVLILSFYSFNVAKAEAEERVVRTSAESMAQRISGLVVDTALFAEKFQDQEVNLTSRLDLPSTLEGRQYTIQLTETDVVVNVPSTGATDASTLFSAHSTGLVHICDQDPIDGGDIYVRISPDSDPTGSATCGVAGGTAQFYVYLESAI